MDSLFEQIAINSIRDKQSLQRRVPPPPIGPPPGAFSPGLGLPPPTPPPTPSRVAPAESEDTDDGFVTFSSSLLPNLAPLANCGSLPLGLLVTPFAPGSPPPAQAGSEVARCPCGALANRFCDVDGRNGRWTCVFCGAASFSRRFVGVSRQAVPELSLGAVRFELGPSQEPEAPLPPLLLLLDESLDADEMAAAAASLRAALAGQPESRPVALLSFGAAVALLDLRASAGGLAQLEMLPGECDGDAFGPSLRSLLSDDSARFLAPLRDARPALEAGLAALRGFRPKQALAERPRCLPAALRAALALLRSHCRRSALGLDAGDAPPGGVAWARAARKGRAIVLLSAAAQRYDYAALGARAANSGARCDLLCAGAAPHVLAALQPLARATGGIAALLDGFGHHGAGAALTALLAAEPVAPAAAAVDCRVSGGFAVARVFAAAGPLPVGMPVVSLDADGRGGEGGGPPPPDSAAAVQVLGAEEGGAALAYLLHLPAGDCVDRTAVIQVTCRTTPRGGGAGALLVLTRRLPCTPHAAAYEAALRPALLTLLAAKEAAADVLQPQSDPGLTAAALQQRLRHAATALGAAPPHRRSGATPLPHRLAAFGAGLYALGRGPLAAQGSLGAHADERIAAASALLRAGLGHGGALAEPILYRLHPGDGAGGVAAGADAGVLVAAGVLSSEPAFDLALAPDAAFILDAGTELTTWLGAGLDPAAAEQLTACATAAMAALATGRLPPPRCRVTRQHASAARHVTARLAPLGRDAPAVQASRLPALRGMSDAERLAAQQRALPTEAVSLDGWLAQAGLRVAEQTKGEEAAAGLSPGRPTPPPASPRTPTVPVSKRAAV